MSLKSTHRERLEKILALSIPIAAATLGTNLIGLIDAAMIGRLGDLPLAASGIGNFIILLFLTVPFGIATGMQTLVARRLGEGRDDIAGHDLNYALLVTTALGLALSIILYFVLPKALPILNRDPGIQRETIDYLNARGPSLALLAMTACFRAFWNGLHFGKRPLIALAVALIANVIFNYLLIFGKFGFPAMGIFGAGLASTIAAGAGVFSYFFLGYKYARNHGFLKKMPSSGRRKQMLSIGLPESANLLFIALGLLMLFFIVGLLGVRELAILNVLINFILIAYLFVEGFGIASLSLISQSLGMQATAEAQRYGWEVASLGSACVFLIGILLLLFPGAIVGIFIVDETTLALAMIPTRLLGIWLWIDAFGKILSFCLIGAGATKTVLIATVIVWWGIGLPTQWLLGVKLGYGINGIFFAPLPVLFCGTLLFTYLWHRGGWKHIRIHS
jgi:MATE family multidrug resistance protein